jgi:glycosyltransferase involved in cell wall biosynthesis
MKISAVLLTRNEEQFIRDCLENIADIVDEIILVDGYSEDNTVQIAKEYTSKIYLREPKGFIEPDRNFAISKADNDWILYIDADERFSQSIRHFIKNRDYQENDHVVAYEFPRRNYYDLNGKKWIKHVFYPDFQIRLFMKNHVLYEGRIHEKPKVISGEIRQMSDEFYITHLVPNHFDLSTFKQHHLKYAKIEAKQREKYKKREYYLFDSFISFFVTFLRQFFVKKGILDGYVGLKASLVLSCYNFMVNYFTWKYYSQKN